MPLVVRVNIFRLLQKLSHSIFRQFVPKSVVGFLNALRYGLTIDTLTVT